MCEIVDPYSYLGRYGRSQTVLVQNAGNDEFFLPSDTWFFWDEMFGEKYLKESYHFIGGTRLNWPKWASGGILGGAIEHFFDLMMTKKDLSKQGSRWSWFKVGFYDYPLSLANLT